MKLHRQMSAGQGSTHPFRRPAPPSGSCLGVSMDSSSLRWSGGAPLAPGVLTRLRQDLGGIAMSRFICIYVNLLPGRLDGMQDALAGNEPLTAVRIADDLR